MNRFNYLTTFVVTGAVPLTPIFLAAPLLKSTTALELFAILSVMVTLVFLPVFLFFTSTFVPSGSLLLAAVIAWGLYLEPLAVFFPLNESA